MDKAHFISLLGQELGTPAHFAYPVSIRPALEQLASAISELPLPPESLGSLYSSVLTTAQYIGQATRSFVPPPPPPLVLPLAAPTLAIKPDSPTVADLSWGAVPQALGYRVLQADGTQSTLLKTVEGNVLSYQATGLVAGSSPAFVVQAFNGDVTSSSGLVSVALPAVLAPSAVAQTAIQAKDQELVDAVHKQQDAEAARLDAETKRVAAEQVEKDRAADLVKAQADVEARSAAIVPTPVPAPVAVPDVVPAPVVVPDSTVVPGAAPFPLPQDVPAQHTEEAKLERDRLTAIHQEQEAEVERQRLLAAAAHQEPIPPPANPGTV